MKVKETNMEHFRSEIESVGYSFGKQDEYVMPCNRCDCDICDFYVGNNMDDNLQGCSERKFKWLMSEYKPEPVLTAREKHFVEFAQEGWMARDKNDCLHWYKAKPKKKVKFNYWDSETLRAISLGRFEGFPFITWEDEEPWSVEELRKLKALEYNPEDVAFKKGGVNDET